MIEPNLHPIEAVTHILAANLEESSKSLLLDQIMPTSSHDPSTSISEPSTDPSLNQIQSL